MIVYYNTCNWWLGREVNKKEYIETSVLSSLRVDQVMEPSAGGWAIEISVRTLSLFNLHK